jgi:recombination protein RecT
MSNNTPATQNENGIEPVSGQMSVSQRFTNQVLKEFGGNVAGGIQVTDYQRQLIQGYFISIDRALKTADENRLRKNENNKDHKYDNPLAITWNNVNLNDLALDVVHYARMGLDMMQDNHLSPIPYKNNKSQKYDITLMPGYNGIQYIAEKYAVEKPVATTIELVYSTDKFRPIKKSKDVKIEGYEFEITNAFDRGEVVGGFGYIEYSDPLRNKLIIMTMKDIEKRKPKYAAAEFWGGKVKVWENGKQVEQESSGWMEEMCLKTIKREVFSAKHMPRDPKKVDDAYQYMKMREARYAEMEAQSEIDTNANRMVIDITPEPSMQLPVQNVDRSTGEVIEVHTIPAQSTAQESMPGLNF